MLLSKGISLIKKKIYCIFLWIKRAVYQEILIIGDSHANVFHNKQFKSYFSTFFFDIVVVGGATVSGLNNPNSKTNSFSIFLNKLKSSKASTTIILLGEVDTGFVIWYRAEKHKTPLLVMLDMAIENYQNLIMEISKKSRVICISTPLPTIKDENNWGDIANARKNIKATQLDRTNLTLLFNNRMHEFCKKCGFVYLSFDEESIGEKGIVKKCLLNSNPNDHHYDMEKYASMIIDKLKNFIG